MRCTLYFIFFFFNDTATTEIYTLSLHDALPIWKRDFVFARDLVDQLRSTNKRRIPGADRALEWHRAVAPGREVGENTTHGRALSRLKHGFESRREGPKGSSFVSTPPELFQRFETRGDCSSPR